MTDRDSVTCHVGWMTMTMCLTLMMWRVFLLMRALRMMTSSRMAMKNGMAAAHRKRQQQQAQSMLELVQRGEAAEQPVGAAEGEGTAGLTVQQVD